MVTADGNKTLLAIVAHPDDETFGMGGTLALYASRGIRVCLICATRGEAGQALPGTMGSYTSLRDLREAELRCAAAALGITDMHFLGYQDSGMAGSESSRHELALVQIPLNILTRHLTDVIRWEKPQVVITHDPVGGYFHPDHIHLQQAVQAACLQAANYRWKGLGLDPWQIDRLFYNTIARGMLRWVVRLMPLFGRDPRRWGDNRDVDLTRILAADIPVHARIDYRVVARQRQAAVRCHASQGGARQERGMAGLLRGWSRSHEVFMQGYPQPEPGKVITDLFQNL